MKTENVKKIAVLGAGRMGHQIAIRSAMHGFETTIFDVSHEQMLWMRQFAADYLAGRVAKGRITQEHCDEATALLHFSENLTEAVKDADFIIEAISEDRKMKEDLFTELDTLAKEDAIFATNSSFYNSSEFAKCVRDPGRLCNMHFFNPPLVLKGVEVMRGEHTSDETFETVAGITERLGMIPTRINKEISGMIANRILTVIMKEALTLHENGYADVPDIDGILKNALGHPMGIFRMQDLSGIDMAYYAQMNLYLRSGNPDDLPRPTIVSHFAKGEWGEKTGKGFYDYQK